MKRGPRPRNSAATFKRFDWLAGAAAWAVWLELVETFCQQRAQKPPPFLSESRAPHQQRSAESSVEMPQYSGPARSMEAAKAPASEALAVESPIVAQKRSAQIGLAMPGKQLVSCEGKHRLLDPVAFFSLTSIDRRHFSRAGRASNYFIHIPISILEAPHSQPDMPNHST
jgi:hypothetical protein